MEKNSFVDSKLYKRLKPTALKVLAIRRRIVPAEKQRRELAEYEQLYVGDDVRTAMEDEQCRNVLLILLVLVIGLCFVTAYILKGNTGGMDAVTELERPVSGSDSRELELLVEGDVQTGRSDTRAGEAQDALEERPGAGAESEFEALDERSGTRPEKSEITDIGKLEVRIDSRRKYGEEAASLLEAACGQLEKVLLADNESADCVRTQLNLVTKLQGSDVTVSYMDLDTSLIRYDGTLKNEELEEPVVTVISAQLQYFEEELIYQMPLLICPPLLTGEERFLQGVEKELKERNDGSRGSGSLKLPTECDGTTLSWYVRRESPIPALILVALAVILIPLGIKQERATRLARRRRQMLLDYPGIINKFTLLLSAGMTVKGAWDKICEDYLSLGKGMSGKVGRGREQEKRFAYEEMLITKNELTLGCSLSTAIEHFGRRVGIKQYTKMCKIVSGNLKHGNKSLLPLLEAEAETSLTERRDMARRQGEEAGTKLLAPMIIMMIIVMAIVMVPSLMSFSGI